MIQVMAALFQFRSQSAIDDKHAFACQQCIELASGEHLGSEITPKRMAINLAGDKSWAAQSTVSALCSR
jgi:hypothetical protein